MYECVCGLRKWLTKFRYRMKWKMMLIAMFFLLHFSKVEGRGFGQWRLSMRFSVASGSAICVEYFIYIWIHTLDKNIRIKLG